MILLRLRRTFAEQRSRSGCTAAGLKGASAVLREVADVAEGEEDGKAIEVHRRADRLRAETSRWRHGGRGCVPADRREQGDLLRVEEEVRELREQRDPRA